MALSQTLTDLISEKVTEILTAATREAIPEMEAEITRLTNSLNRQTDRADYWQASALFWEKEAMKFVAREESDARLAKRGVLPDLSTPLMAADVIGTADKFTVPTDIVKLQSPVDNPKEDK